MDKTEALRLAKDAYDSSTTYVDANFRKQWEDALKTFQSRHPDDSKYTSDQYKYRSKIFRPKTRSLIRKNEAAAAAAFFSNIDVVNVLPSNPNDENQLAGALLYKELLQYRLTKSIPWFMTLLGGFQDAMTVGVVCSHQHWKYRVARSSQDQMIQNVETGAAYLGQGGPMLQKQVTEQVLEDCPAIDLLPVETLRIDRGANWTDPVNTSPYLIHLIPMYIGDIKQLGKRNEKTGEEGWDIPEDGVMLGAMQQTDDSTRQTRENQREDSKDTEHSITEFSIVWVHKNIIKKDGEDWCFYTLGNEHVLSKPRLLKEYYAHGERPYTMGVAILETHKIYPGGFPELGSQVQKELNEIVNSRLDNVKLVMNKRYIVKRGAQVDLQSLVRNAAGSITLANDPTGDVQSLEFSDVTGSSFQEQDRLNVDFDELVGNFSSSSVQTNRKLNETVGGMSLIAQGANQLTEYTIRTFTETWVEPVLRQLIMLEKEYETDENVIKIMGEKTGTQILAEDFDVDVELTVNVGMGATDPMMRLNKLLIASRSFAEVVAMGETGLDTAELGKEIFGAVGYRDGERFMRDDQGDPRLQEMMQVVEGMKGELQGAQQALQSKESEVQGKMQIEGAKLQLGFQEAETKPQLEQMKIDQEQDMDQKRMMFEAEQKRLDREQAWQQFMADLASKREIEYAKLGEAPPLKQNVETLQNALPPIVESLEGLPSLVSAVQELAGLITQTVRANEQLQQTVSEAAQVFSAPRELIRDANGRPQGSRIKRTVN